MRRAGRDAINNPLARLNEFHPTQLKEAILLTDGLLKNVRILEPECLPCYLSHTISQRFPLLMNPPSRT